VLLKDSLIGVISLPSGVFQPYSGVKTSILVLDKRIARNRPKIMFSDIQAIGVSLGIKRTLTEENHLPLVLKDYAAYYAGTALSNRSFLADRSTVIENDCNLSAERYRPVVVRAGTRAVKLREVCTLTKGSHSSTKTEAGPYPLIVTAKGWLTSSDYEMEGEAVCVPLISSTGHGKASINRVHFVSGKYAVANLLAALQPKDGDVLSAKFLYLVLDAQKEKMAGLMKGAANVSMKVEDLAEFQIPLPPLEVQKEIVAEIEGYQKVINGASAVLDHYRPHIPIHPDWPLVKLGEVCSYAGGTQPPKDTFISEPRDGYIRLLQIRDYKSDKWKVYIPTSERHKTCEPEDIMIGRYGPPVFQILKGKRGAYNVALIKCIPNLVRLERMWLYLFLSSARVQETIIALSGRVRQSGVNPADLDELQIPLPPLSTQQAIVAEIEAEQALVAANRELITRFEQKIQVTLARVWGEEAPSA
jgi:type I restriction enzyme M protein